jgi:hypothetical protein
MANDDIDDMMFGGAEWMMRDPSLKDVENPLHEAALANKRNDHAAEAQFLRTAWNQSDDPVEKERLFQAGVRARNRAIVDRKQGITPTI